MKIFALVLAGLLLSCGSPSAAQPTRAPSVASSEPTTAPAAATAAPEPTSAPTAELATAEPTDEPTRAIAATPFPTLAGAAAQGSDCPADHPVKGNIVDRGANKGEKIYHLASSASYKATKPERCFVDSKEAEAAGFRAPK